MKINKTIIAVASGCVVAATGYSQDLWSELGASGGAVNPGKTYSATFVYTEIAGNAEVIPDTYFSGSAGLSSAHGFYLTDSYSGVTSPFSSISIVSITGPGYNSGNGDVTLDQPFDINVSFTISPTATIGQIANITTSFSADSGAYESAVSSIYTVTPVSVPEPGQTVAGAMLLGCGSLVFVGRRMFKKQTV